MAVLHKACSYSLSAMAVLRGSRKSWWPILLKTRVCDVMQCHWVIDAPPHLRRTETSHHCENYSRTKYPSPLFTQKPLSFISEHNMNIYISLAMDIHFTEHSHHTLRNSQWTSEAIMNILKLTEAHRNICYRQTQQCPWVYWWWSVLCSLHYLFRRLD